MGVNEIIGHVNEAIISEELESINKITSIHVTHTCNKEINKHKENSSVNDIKEEWRTSRRSENTEETRDIYVCMYECGKHLLHSTYKYVCA